MMPKWILLGAAFVLPHVQPTWSGMIVRCEQPQAANIIVVGQNPETAPCAGGKCKCWWECEFGVTTSQVVEDGNQTAKPTGCNPYAPDRRGTYITPWMGGMITPTNTINAIGTL